MKMLRDKYTKLKMENAEQKKKLMAFEVNNRTLNSLSDASTPLSVQNQRNANIRYNTYIYDNFILWNFFFENK